MVLLSTETRLFTDLTHSDRVSTSTSSFLAQRRAYSSTESNINLEFCFQVKDLGSLYLGPLERMSLSLANPDYIKVSCYDVTGWIIAEHAEGFRVMFSVFSPCSTFL